MNDKQANDAVAIELRNTDWNLELEPRDGEHKTTSTTKELEETLKKHDEPRNRWNTIFTISCAIAIFIDPLYCYAPVIHGKCLELHQTLMWTYIGLRSAVDVFYAINLVTLWPGIGNKLGAFWTRSNQKTVISSKEEKKGLLVGVRRHLGLSALEVAKRQWFYISFWFLSPFQRDCYSPPYARNYCYINGILLMLL